MSNFSNRGNAKKESTRSIFVFIIPLALLFILGIVTFLSPFALSTLRLGHYVVVPTSTSDVLTQSQNLLSFTTLVFSVVVAMASLIAAIGLWIYKKKLAKLDAIEDKLSTINSTILTNMEIVILGLPNLDESQSIPAETAEIAKEIENIFQINTDLEAEIDKIGNGDRLRLVRAIHYHATGDYGKSIALLREVVDRKLGDLETRALACYRLGIAYRQINEYENSIDCFKKVLNGCV